MEGDVAGKDESLYATKNQLESFFQHASHPFFERCPSNQLRGFSMPPPTPKVKKENTISMCATAEADETFSLSLSHQLATRVRLRPSATIRPLDPRYARVQVLRARLRRACQLRRAHQRRLPRAVPEDHPARHLELDVPRLPEVLPLQPGQLRRQLGQAAGRGRLDHRGALERKNSGQF